MAWPARSLDLNTMDYFVWGFLKIKVYATPVQSEQQAYLLARFMVACISIRKKAKFHSHRKVNANRDNNWDHFKQKLNQNEECKCLNGLSFLLVTL